MTTATRLLTVRSVPFSPAQLPNLALWLKADAITGLVDTDPVTTWADASGNSRDATQATAGLKPLYKTAIVGGKPIVRFDGTDDTLVCNGIAATFSGTDVAFSVFAVTKLAATAVAHYPILNVYNSGDGNPFYSIRNNWPTLHIHKQDNTGALVNVGGGTPDTNPHVLSYVSPGTTLGVWTDGTAVAGPGTAFDLGATTVNAANVGSQGAALFHGDMAELVVFARAVTTAEQTQMQRYLGAKYGIGVA